MKLKFLFIIILILLFNFLVAIPSDSFNRFVETVVNFGLIFPIKTADDLNKVMLGLGGLIGAATGVPFLIWRTLISQRQNTIAQASLDTTTMARAIEQLGATKEVKARSGDDALQTLTELKPNLEVRLGALYLLEQLAQGHKGLHWHIMEILCAYVRENAGPPDNLRSDRPRVDVQAAITVIGRRSAKQMAWEAEQRDTATDKSIYRLDLTNCHLPKARFDGLNFSRARLSGSRLHSATFRKSWLTEADLESADLTLGRLEGAKLSGSHLNAASFIEARLNGATLHKAHLIGAHLGASRMQGVDLGQSHLEAADLARTDLEGANLSSTHLEGACLRKACLKGSRLDGAHLDDAFVAGTNFSDASGVTSGMVTAAWGDDETVLPDGVVHPDSDQWVKMSEFEPSHQQLWAIQSESRLFSALNTDP